MYYISTSAVFDGNKPLPYTLRDVPNPLNVYGKTKFEGELIIKKLLKRWCIIRASWMIGGGKIHDKKFVGKIVSKLKNNDPKIQVVNDKYGSITYAQDLVRALRLLIASKKRGLFHFSNGGLYTRYDLAMEMKSILGNSVTTIEAVDSTVFPLPAPRGHSEALKCSPFLNSALHLPSWKETLRHYLLSDYQAHDSHPASKSSCSQTNENIVNNSQKSKPSQHVDD